MARTLVITNDFPPRSGGIQAFVHELLRRQPADQLVVYAPQWAGSAAFDAESAFPVFRHPGSLMLPSPAVYRRAAVLLRRYRCDTVLFGAAAPLGLLGPSVRSAGARRVVALTHGHEAGWAQLPVARATLRRIGAGVDVLTHLGRYTGGRIAAALRPADRGKLVRLAPGVDDAVFRPGSGGAALRERLGLGERPVVVCVSRLVARKGQDVLIRALPTLRSRVPGTTLLLVGGGPDRRRLTGLAHAVGVADSVVFAGDVASEALPAAFDAGDVFAMPCRTRRHGLDVEGLGIVYLEASATGLPVVAGDSGGAPDAVRPGETGYVVDGRCVRAVAGRVGDLLADRRRARQMGAAGRRWVGAQWQWDGQARRLSDLLSGRQP